MRFHTYHEQLNAQEVKNLVVSQPLGLLITSSGANEINVGLYNAYFDGNRFLIHLGRTDEQSRNLQTNKTCHFIFFETLSVIPSFWIDERYGGAINNFFKFAQFDCESRVIEEIQELKEVMQILLDEFQEERKYDPLDPRSEIYRDKFRQICAVELKVVRTHTKWNLGQTKPVDAWLNVLKELKKRNKGTDPLTVNAMETWVKEHPL